MITTVLLIVIFFVTWIVTSIFRVVGVCGVCWWLSLFKVLTYWPVFLLLVTL